MVQHHNSVYLLGGYDGNYRKDVWQFLPEMGFSHFVAKPMKHTRSSFACGIFNSKFHSNRPIMVAAGGYGSGSETGEFWDFTNPTATWQPTGNFPVYEGFEFMRGLEWGPQMTTTRNGDGLLLTHRKAILKLDCTSTTSCLWKKEPNSLQVHRFHHLMFTVPSSLLENCNN